MGIGHLWSHEFLPAAYHWDQARWWEVMSPGSQLGTEQDVGGREQIPEEGMRAGLAASQGRLHG